MRAAICLTFFLFAASAWPQAPADMVGELRAGGYVLYMRHAATDFGQNDARMTSYEDCARQRNLTAAGREEAHAIGAHLRRLQIPIGEVLASPYCRTMETARLVFGKAQASQDVRGGPVRSDDPARYAGLRKLLSAEVPKGENRAISSHGNPFQAVAGPPYLAEGEMAVIRPGGDGRFTVIARLRPQDWSNLPAAGGPASSGAP